MTMNDPRYKFGITALLIVAALLGGYFGILDGAFVQTLIVGAAGFAVGYGVNGFGRVYAGLTGVQESVSAAVRSEIEPLATRLCAVEDAVGIVPVDPT